MYKTAKNPQHSFLDFNQPLGLHMNPKKQMDRHGRPHPMGSVSLLNEARVKLECIIARFCKSYGLGLIVTKLEETQLHSIALSVFVSNL